jgi:hypothetical protein
MNIRDKLVEIVLEWEKRFTVAPRVTGDIAEYDAARLVGCTEEDYAKVMQGRTAVSKGDDFAYNGIRYQVKSNRSSGKPGSFVTKVNGPTNFDWDKLIWILYDKAFQIQEAWLWDVVEYKDNLGKLKRLSPNDLRKGKSLTSQSSRSLRSG